MRKFKRWALLGLAHVSVALGFLGIFLPLLPTTPFLLLSAAIYLKTSIRFYSWLMNHRIFGRILYDYMIHRSVKFKHKLMAWIMLWLGMGTSFVLVPVWWVRLILVGIGLAVSLHIFLLKTRPPNVEDSHIPQSSLQKK
jgi:uncharacterized membrane protein YbaN (DUF454 family)